MKKNLVSVAVVAGLSLGVSSQASASVYASARVLVDNVKITINDDDPILALSTIPGDVQFNTNASAQLNGNSADDPQVCGTLASVPDCPVDTSPVLTSLANAPGSTANRAAGDFNYMGPDTPADTESYANSQATIVTSELFSTTGELSEVNQISEVELQGSGVATADTLVSSTTQFAFTIPAGPAPVGPNLNKVDIDFTADVDRFVSITTPGLQGNAVATANTEFTFSLIGNNGVVIDWSPDGAAGGFVCENTFFGTLPACIENTDSERLGGNTGLPPFINPFNVGYSDSRATVGTPDLGVQDYSFSISNLEAGADTLELTINTSVSASQTVPEPSNLALLGLGLFGMGFVQRRKAGKKS